MKQSVFELRPRLSCRGDPAWQGSLFQRPCRVVTSSPMRARFWAAGAFTMSLTEQPCATDHSPWLLASLVTVYEVGPGDTAGVHEEGMILVQDQDHSDLWQPLSLSSRGRLMPGRPASPGPGYQSAMRSFRPSRSDLASLQAATTYVLRNVVALFPRLARLPSGRN